MKFVFDDGDLTSGNLRSIFPFSLAEQASNQSDTDGKGNGQFDFAASQGGFCCEEGTSVQVLKLHFGRRKLWENGQAFVIISWG